MNYPIDWDHESYCSVFGCNQPATHRTLTSLADGLPVYELICCTHARRRTPPPTCPHCGRELIEDPDGGPGYPTLNHRNADERAQCLGAQYG